MKKYNVNVIAIIPAKTDSVRLKNKNLQIIDSRSLVEHSIIYAERSKYIREIYVNTESQEIKNYSKTYPIKIIERNKKLMGKTEVVEVYIESMKEIYNQTELDNIDIVIGLQPDHPDRMINIDNAIEYFIENTYDDLFTVDDKGTRNGSIRITKAVHVVSGKMSRRVGSLLDNCTNIHDEDDLVQAEKNIKNK